MENPEPELDELAESKYEAMIVAECMKDWRCKAMTPVEQVLNIAKGEIGYLEKASNSNLDSKTANAGSANYTKYARDLDAAGAFSGKVNGYAWCASYVAWCFYKAFGLDRWSKITGIPIGGNGASCTSCVSYYRKTGRFHVSNPQPGDQIFFKTSDGSAYAHTGLVCSVSASRVYTYEGNTSGASGVVANGGGVVAKDYALSYSRIGGYGRPDYSAVTVKEDEDTMTGEQIYSALMEYMGQGKLSDKVQAELQEAVELGITDGSNPTQAVTRAQAAVMAKRAYKAAVDR